MNKQLKLSATLIICILVLSTDVIATNKVIHISVDGLYAPAIPILGSSRLPNIYRMIDEGATTLNAQTDFNFTNTLPNHTSQFTGRAVSLLNEGHGWMINSDPGGGATIHANAGEYVHSIFDVVSDAGLSTSLFAGKDKFDIFERSWSSKIDSYDIRLTNSSALTSDFLTDLAQNKRDYGFLHLKNPDTAGHVYDWRFTVGSFYMDSIVAVDSFIGTVLAFIESNQDYKGVTTLIVTADHGGTSFLDVHDGATASDHKIPFLVWGRCTQAGNIYDFNPSITNESSGTPNYSGVQPVRNLDAANLAAYLLDLEQVPGSFRVGNIYANEKQNCSTSAGYLPAVIMLLDDD